MPELLAGGWTVAHRSWAARTAAPDERAPLEALVAAAAAQGCAVAELGPADDAAVEAFAASVRADFPGGLATAPHPVDAASIARDRAAGTRWFGAKNGGDLVAVTVIRADGERAETDWTAVRADHRRRGLAEGVKAASLLALAADGVCTFGTGGADENAPSLAMNRRLGYVVTERWVTLVPAP
ncbi:GNAT family N-acetyltransferase [Amnibacterium endophyticum]|uniref:GNAT family N-acetyltransferase n=1 Tax=Amnibacterium endophyticum TaxID=2109337 RepID=A0ABW4LDQ9_9MICO